MTLTGIELMPSTEEILKLVTFLQRSSLPSHVLERLAADAPTHWGKHEKRTQVPIVFERVLEDGAGIVKKVISLFGAPVATVGV